MAFAIVSLVILSALQGLVRNRNATEPGPTLTPTATVVRDLGTFIRVPTREPDAGPIPPPVMWRLTALGCCPLPFWSADSKTVLYWFAPPGQEPGIFGAKVDGGIITYVSDWPVAVHGSGAFTATLSGNQTILTRVADGKHWSFATGRDGWIAVSPDQRRVASVSLMGRPVPGLPPVPIRHQLVDLQTGATRTIGVPGGYAMNGWTADGVWLLVLRDGGVERPGLLRFNPSARPAMSLVGTSGKSPFGLPGLDLPGGRATGAARVAAADAPHAATTGDTSNAATPADSPNGATPADSATPETPGDTPNAATPSDPAITATPADPPSVATPAVPPTATATASAAAPAINETSAVTTTSAATTTATTTSSQSGRLRAGRLSPGGKWMIYLRTFDRNTENNGIWIVSTRFDGPPRKLDPALTGGFRWRDADRLLLVPQVQDQRSMALFQMNVATGEVEQLVDPRHYDALPFRIAAGEWSVSPDGHHVAFRNVADQALWVMLLP